MAELTGVPAYVLRYWESEFRLLRPRKSPAGQRLYRRHEVELVLRIKQLLYGERLTLEGARRRLQQEARRRAEQLQLPTPDPQTLELVRGLRRRLEAMRRLLRGSREGDAAEVALERHGGRP